VGSEHDEPDLVRRHAGLGQQPGQLGYAHPIGAAIRRSIWLSLAALALLGCSGARPQAKGKLVVAVTIDWEGVEFSPEGLDALDELRRHLGSAPVTHFVSAAYFTKDHPDPRAVSFLTEAVRPGDELASHLHLWKSLAKASGIEPKLSPSYVTGTDKLYEFPDGDRGFDTDLDVYSVADLRAMIRTSRTLLERTHLPVSRSFRAGGYLGSPKVLQAIRQEGYAIDSSATDHRQLDPRKDAFLSRRIQEVWPNVTAASRPFFADTQGQQVLEMPIAATADYVTAAELARLFDTASDQWQKAPDRDVFVVLACNQETAQDFAGRLADAIDRLRERHPVADHLVFTTVEKAAALARSAL
jgi:hypothetical protein